MLQDHLDRVSNYSDTALVDFVFDTNNTNILTNPGPDCITEDELDFCRDNVSDKALRFQLS